MSQARTNARRRRQAANGFAHMAKKKRPNYRIWDAAISAERLKRVIATERKMASKKS